MSASLIYMTAASRAEALKIARALVEDRLIACANVLDGATSVFRWQGEMHEETEAVMIAKTEAELVPALTARVRALHSYECPCVVAIGIDDGNPDFLRWVAAETAIRP